jgi:hypothetical protein
MSIQRKDRRCEEGLVNGQPCSEDPWIRLFQGLKVFNHQWLNQNAFREPQFWIEKGGLTEARIPALDRAA